MNQQPDELNTTAGQPSPATPEPQWGAGAARGARAVFSRIIKEGANVPLFLGQTVVNALRDLGYNSTTSAVCEHADNSFQWGAKEVRVYFHEKGRKDSKEIDVLIMDDGIGMSPNVLRAATSFGGSLCYDNREVIGKYGMGMKAAALSIGPILEIYSWQGGSGIYRMILDTQEISNDRSNTIQLPEPTLVDILPAEIREILVRPMVFPRNVADQDLFASSDEQLSERLPSSGTIIYIPDCDRLTYRTARTLAEHATKEMARIYRRFLGAERRLYINNRQVRPFDPTYRMDGAWHTMVADLTEKHSRLVRTWKIPVPVEEASPVTGLLNARLFLLPIEHWDQLSRKVLKNELHVFDNAGVSFVRNEREVYMGAFTAITGKGGHRDHWWRLEIDFPAELDEAMGVAINKQGVRPKGYVLDLIKRELQEELLNVRKVLESHWARRAVEASQSKQREAEQRATEAEALQSTLFPEDRYSTEEEKAAYEQQLRVFATAYKREGESDDDAYDRINRSKYITTFKSDEDAAFYRVDYQLGKVILTINTAHAFFDSLYKPLTQIAKRTGEMGIADGDEIAVDSDLVKTCGDALVSLELALLSLARTQAEMMLRDADGERRRTFDQMRRQWSLNLATQMMRE
jgi:hypothetical protein